MKNHSEWPALCPASAWPDKLKYSRAVWGKVHGASSDYRWIALNAGLVPEADLQTQFIVGVEDLPESSLLWRNMSGRCHAVICYPSRATDAAGRTGFLEKQVLSWDRGNLPAALGAMVLLQHAASLDDGIWWNRYEGQPWTSPDFALPIDPADHEPLPVRPQDFVDTVEQGLAEIWSEIGIERLQALYASILAGSRPAFLTGLQKPLSAAAMAALLLPLPRERADSLSLASWVPSRRGPLGLWDVVVLPPGWLELAGNSAEVDARFQAEGRRLAEMLFGQEPIADPLVDLLQEPFKVEQASQPQTAEPVPLRRPIPGLLIEELKSSAPSRSAPDALKRLHSFAVEIDRRWLEPDALGGLRPGQIDARKSPIPDWIRILDKRRPAWVSERQWLVKLDLLRCAALILHPHPRVDLPTTGLVPALHFASWVPPVELLTRLGRDKFQFALEQSLLSGRPRMRKLLGDWSRQPGRGNADIQEMIKRALGSVAA